MVLKGGLVKQDWSRQKSRVTETIDPPLPLYFVNQMSLQLPTVIVSRGKGAGSG